MAFSEYTSLFSIFLFVIALIPAIILGLLGKKTKYYGILISVPILCMLMGFNSIQMVQFIGFIVYESFLIMAYYFFHRRSKNKILYYSVFLLSVLPLFLVKVCSHSDNFNFLGFLGISYISFRVFQIIIEIHDDHMKDFSFVDMLYFITFFPTLTSGPIDRYNRFLENINMEISREEYAKDYLYKGIKKMFLGIFYKFGIATLIDIYIMDRLPSEKTAVSVIIYMYAYTFYLFFDFAGYSDLAISTGYFLGVKVPENFNKPFLAHNMKEFWDRWHISLSKWFGDYVFSRFVLNTIRNGIFNNRKFAIRCGYLITMMIMGLWHGFYVFYIVYGVYHGLMLIFTDIYVKSKVYKKFKKSKYYDFVSRLVCFQVIAVGMLIFSGYLFKF